MKVKIFQIDAFTNQLYRGNPAAVVLLDKWLPDEELQSIAIENNLAETAFVIPLEEQRYHLRWFTPEFEMDLCGHATLATAYVLFEEVGHKASSIHFESRSGILTVTKKDDFYELDFPSRPPSQSELPAIIKESLNIQPVEVWKARDYLLLYTDEKDIINLAPNEGLLSQINIDPGGVVATAKGTEVDFVSRFFTPQASIFEDPVTGSAHCTLVPFWAERLGKEHFHAKQLSRRAGNLVCTLKNDRVQMKGQAVKYLEGYIFV